MKSLYKTFSKLFAQSFIAGFALFLTVWITHASVNIIPRADWWANEEFIFRDSAEWQGIISGWSSWGSGTSSGPSKTTLIYNELRQRFPAYFEMSQTLRYWDDRPLATPIERSNKIRKIVVHHTATNSSISTEKSDLQGIYRYHALSRQWGDIGYNFIIGKSGNIYEWKAGGHAVRGFHNAWNNEHSVGVSLLGNFNNEKPNREQLTALIQIIRTVVGIYDIEKADTLSFRECKNNCGDSNIDVLQTDWLIGHTDAGHTSCPGTHLHPLLDTIQAGIENNLSTDKIVSSLLPREPDPVNISTSTTYPSGKLRKGEVKYDANLQSIKNVDLDSPIRIRLSYPHDTISLSDRDGWQIELLRGDSWLAIPSWLQFWVRWDSLTISLSWQTLDLGLNVLQFQASPIVKIDSWSRKPTWDTANRYNDNLFRGTIELRAIDGDLVVINELPLEEYLKWLWEVSESTIEHKAKTILVSARTYALFYTSDATRKFPGQPYDWSDDPNQFQKYLWYGYELRSPTIAKYAEETRWQIITYEGDIIKSWYFNNSDGRTRSYAWYCENHLNTSTRSCGETPFLTSVREPMTDNPWHNAHWVGISWSGAEVFAQAWGNYEQIIQYYLKGTRVVGVK